MRIFNLENGKLSNNKQYNFSNYSKYKHILAYNKNSKNNSVNDMINKMYLRKNNKNLSIRKKMLLNENISIPLIHSNELSLGKKKNEKIIERYYMNEKNMFKNLLKKFTKLRDSSNIRNFSFTNNFINSKVNQYEEKLKLNKKRMLQNASNFFWNEKSEEKNEINYPININKKNIESSTNKTNINIKENSIDDEIYKIKVNNLKNKEFNKVFNKYISKNIINNLKSFNKIRHLIKINGFSLNINDIKNIYKENDTKDEKESQGSRIDTQSMMKVKRLDKIEKLKNEKSFYNFYKERDVNENMNKKISRNKILPLIKSEMKEGPNKLRIIMNLLNNKNEIKNYKLLKKEITIKREVNKFYLENKYKSFEEFYNDWLKNSKHYLTINDIEFFLNKIIKVSIQISKEEIIKIFFNNNIKIDQLDYFNFKKFFRPYDMYNKKDDANIKGQYISNEALIYYENNLCSKILKNKEILLNNLELQKGSKTNRNNNKYYLNFEEFYSLIKSKIIIYQNNYFDIVIRKLFNENFDLRTNKINILNLIYKINLEQNNTLEYENQVNNSDIINNLQNKTRKKFLHRINSLKDDIQINSFKNKILGKEEILNKSERKITNFIKLDKSSLDIVNNIGKTNYLNDFSKLNSLKLEFENNKKNKNSDIINLI